MPVLYCLCGLEKDTIISYLAYIVSTYTLIVGGLRNHQNLKGSKKGGLCKSVYKPSPDRRAVRVRISLYGSFIINLAYAFVKLVSGIVYHSVWFGAIASILYGSLKS